MRKAQGGHKKRECRCEECVQWRRDRARRRSRMIAYGRWEPWGDLEEVRAHLHGLRARGISYKRVAALSGVPVSTVMHVLRYGGKVTRETAAKLLAVVYDPEPEATRIPVDGTMRRVRALAALGWSSADIAEAAKVSRSTVAEIMRGGRKTVQAETAEAVAAVYRELGMRWAPKSREADLVRMHAQERGWPTPAAWDEHLIDLPGDELREELVRQTSLLSKQEKNRFREAFLRGERSPVVVTVACGEWRDDKVPELPARRSKRRGRAESVGRDSVDRGRRNASQRAS